MRCKFYVIDGVPLSYKGNVNIKIIFFRRLLHVGRGFEVDISKQS